MSPQPTDCDKRAAPGPLDGAAHCTPQGFAIVLDTNIVLDLWVFDDPASQSLSLAVQRGHTRWLATLAMRDELARVLDYPHIARRLDARTLSAGSVLAHFDRHAQLQPDAPRAPYVCKDADQKFIDLAVQHRAALHSKDAQILCMKNRLARCGVLLNPALADLPLA